MAVETSRWDVSIFEKEVSIKFVSCLVRELLADALVFRILNDNVFTFLPNVSDVIAYLLLQAFVNVHASIEVGEG